MPNHPKSPHLWLVNPATGCWVWQRACNNNGYGLIRLGGKNVLAHRHVYQLHRGPIPDGLELDHVKERCSTTRCVNPDHMEPVTHAENTRRGKLAKITQEQAEIIRASTEFGRVLGQRYGISKAHANMIKKGLRRA